MFRLWEPRGRKVFKNLKAVPEARTTEISEPHNYAALRLKIGEST